jgi:hypothetical protein
MFWWVLFGTLLFIALVATKPLVWAVTALWTALYGKW